VLKLMTINLDWMQNFERVYIYRHFEAKTWAVQTLNIPIEKSGSSSNINPYAFTYFRGSIKKYPLSERIFLC
jgi:hypothetical protein